MQSVFEKLIIIEFEPIWVESYLITRYSHSGVFQKYAHCIVKEMEHFYLMCP